MDEVVKFVGCSCVLDVVDNYFQNIDAECTRGQFLVKSRVDDTLEDHRDCPEPFGVQDDLGNGSVNAEMKTSLNLELLKFIANVLDHVIEILKMLFIKASNVCQQICFLLFGLNSNLEFGDLYGVVCGQCQGRGSCNQKSNVPLASLMFWNMLKACKKVMEEFENLDGVQFVQLKCTVECSPAVF